MSVQPGVEFTEHAVQDPKHTVPKSISEAPTVTVRFVYPLFVTVQEEPSIKVSCPAQLS